MEGAMSQLFYLSTEQLERIKPFFPRSHSISRVDGLRVLSGIIYVISMACSGRMLLVGMALIKLV